VIVKSTIDLAHNLGLTVVAEGVETSVEQARLAAMGCDAVQGLFISPPARADRIQRWLKERAAPRSA
jgi:EAL domain-containing protein (putative c-di-GMP-specific phosphodiesterase class I)